MKFRGKEITKKMVVMLALALFMVGTASAVLVSYVTAQLTATAVVTPVGLTVSSSASLDSADPSLLTYTPGPAAKLTNPTVAAGGETGTTVNIANTGADVPANSASISLGLTFTEDPVNYADPFNCISGVYNSAGTESCDSCDATGFIGAGAGAPCVDGQEFEVIGTRVSIGPGTWFPATAACTAAGLAPGDVTATYYLDLSNNCFFNFRDAVIAAGVLPANPANLVSFPITSAIPSGTSFYGQIVVKTTTLPVDFVQIAPGTYVLTVDILPT